MSETRLFFTLYLLLTVTPAVFYDVVGHEPVKATVGEDVVLLCRLEPPFDVSSLTVEWTQDDLIVHLYRNGGDNYDFQDEQFRGRTSLFHSELIRGIISLKLTDVTEEDSGVYVCYVPRLNSQANEGKVLLTVNPRDQDGGRGGNYETEDDKKQSGDKRGVIVGIFVGSVILLLVVLLVLGWKYKDTLETLWNERWRIEGNNHRNHRQGEGGNPAERKPLGPVP